VSALEQALADYLRITRARTCRPKIPSLSTYLGHREPSSTYWYVSAAPELLALAVARQDAAWWAARSRR
jgi:hypothetical protein